MNGTTKLDMMETEEQKKPAEKDAVQSDSRVIPANFTDDQKKEVSQLIEDEMELIKTELESEGFFDSVQSCKENYEAAHNADANALSGGYDIRIPLQKILVDILVSRTLRQTFQADPIVLMEKEGDLKDDDLHTRENKLDFTMRNQVRYEELAASIYEHAIYEPVCITKTYECHEEEEITRVETYAPEDIKRFESEYAAALVDSASEEFTQWQRLQAGQTVTVPVTETKVLYSGPRVYRVDNDKFFARPRIKDFRKQRVHGEQMDYTWADIEMRVNNKSYGWDSGAVEAIKKAYGDDYRKAVIPFYEMVTQYAKEKDGKTRRYIVTIESKTREIVKAVLYTNEEMCYTAHSVCPKDDSWIGESMLPLINDLIDIVNANLNYMLYSNDLGHTPVIMASDPEAITRRAIELGLVNVIPFQKDTTFQSVTLTDPGFDRINFINVIMDLISLLSGIDPQLLSGAETPNDPRAPAAKTAMKMQVTNMRIEDKILRLQYGDVQVCEKVEKILASTVDSLDYWNKGIQVSVPREAYKSPVRYVMHGSKMTFSRQMDLQLVMQFVEILERKYPGLWADYEVKRDVLNIIINDMGGSVRKSKDKITARLDAYIEITKKVEALKKLMGGQGGMPGQEAPGTGEPIPEISNGAGAAASDMGGSSMPTGGASAPSAGVAQ